MRSPALNGACGGEAAECCGSGVGPTRARISFNGAAAVTPRNSHATQTVYSEPRFNEAAAVRPRKEGTGGDWAVGSRSSCFNGAAAGEVAECVTAQVHLAER